MLRKNITKVGNIRSVSAAAFFPILVVSLWTTGFAQEVEYIDSDACLDCHEYGIHDTRIKEDLSHSSHEFLACLDCHQDKDMVPHAESDLRSDAMAASPAMTRLPKNTRDTVDLC